MDRWCSVAVASKSCPPTHQTIIIPKGTLHCIMNGLKISHLAHTCKTNYSTVSVYQA